MRIRITTVLGCFWRCPCFSVLCDNDLCCPDLVSCSLFDWHQWMSLLSANCSSPNCTMVSISHSCSHLTNIIDLWFVRQRQTNNNSNNNNKKEQELERKNVYNRKCTIGTIRFVSSVNGAPSFETIKTNDRPQQKQEWRDIPKWLQIEQRFSSYSSTWWWANVLRPTKMKTNFG